MVLYIGKQNIWKVSLSCSSFVFMKNTMGKLLSRAVWSKLYGVWRVDVWAREWAL